MRVGRDVRSTRISLDATHLASDVLLAVRAPVIAAITEAVIAFRAAPLAGATVAARADASTRTCDTAGAAISHSIARLWAA